MTVEVAVGGMIASGAWRRAKKTITAPMPRNIASKPIAAGKLNVMDGIRLPCTTLADWSTFSKFARSAPQTKQRVASSFTLVPQVGQIFVGVVFVSGVIMVGDLGFSPDLAHYTSFFCTKGAALIYTNLL